jgi:hypothetical protein
VKKRLGEILLERRLIDVDQLNAALGHQRQWGIRLGTALVAKGFIGEGLLMKVLSEALNIPMVDLSKVQVDPKALALVPARMCEQHEIFPLAIKEPATKGGRRTLLIAMADPLKLTAIDEVAFTADCQVSAAIAQTSSLDDAIQRYYHGQKREISPLNFSQTISLPPLDEHTNPAAQRPASTSAGPAAPFMDYSDEHDEPSVPPLVVGVSVLENRSLSPDDPYAGQPTGAFAIARSDEGGPLSAAQTQAAPQVSARRDGVITPVELESLEAIEKKFWALMRVLTRRGLVTKDEFLAELALTEKR